MASPGRQLPAEMIHRVLSFLVACYIDDLITGPLSLPFSLKDAETRGDVSVYPAPSPLLPVVLTAQSRTPRS